MHDLRHSDGSLLTFQERIVKSLIQRRQQLGITQRILEERIGIAEGHLRKWENLKRKPSAYLFHCWAESLDCEILIVPKESLNAAQ